MGFLMPKPPTPQAPPPPPPVPPLQIQQDKRPKKKSMTPSFLGEAATPDFGLGGGAPMTYGKTLLGQ